MKHIILTLLILVAPLANADFVSEASIIMNNFVPNGDPTNAQKLAYAEEAAHLFVDYRPNIMCADDPDTETDESQNVCGKMAVADMTNEQKARAFVLGWRDVIVQNTRQSRKARDFASRQAAAEAAAQAQTDTDVPEL